MLKNIDHIVLTTACAEKIIKFYEKFGFKAHFNGRRYELAAGNFKINLHILGSEISPHAGFIAPGSGDFCIETDENLENFVARIAQNGVVSFSGIVPKMGAKGEMRSAYWRDPDGNLLEICEYCDKCD